MSILINMEMPVFEHQSWDIRKGTDGKWYMVDTNAETTDGELHEIVPVPPHGRLIDADAIRADIDEKRPGRSYEDAWALTIMDAAPTILEAEEGE